MGKPEMTPEFCEFIRNRAANMSAKEMCQDIDFASRLLGDVFGAKQRRFNKSGSKSKNEVTTMDLLWAEFQSSKRAGG
jgi:hypothetical protein